MPGLLDGKTIVVFAATGAIGSAVAKTAVAEGATVFASGHRAGAVEKLTNESAPSASCSVVDATRPDEVERHLSSNEPKKAADQ